MNNTDFSICYEGFNSFSGLPSEILQSVEIYSVDNNDGDEAESTAESHEEKSREDIDTGTLVEEEEQETGVVKPGIYKLYWKAVGGCLAPSVLITLFLMQGT